MPRQGTGSGPTPPTSSNRPTGPNRSASVTSTGATASNTAYANYAAEVAQELLAAVTGSTPQIPNALATGGLNTALLVDPVKIRAYRESIADQMNAQSGGPRFEDLSERVVDVIIDDTAQGAGYIEVHLIDPSWALLISGFVQTDIHGYLWPPIDINFPTDTDCVWRLCQVAASVDISQPNMVFTFEDRIISQLRSMSVATGGIVQGQPNQTLGGFFKQLIDSANKVLKSNIRLVELISPQDPNYTLPVTQLPTSATKGLRKNPTKHIRGLTTAQINQLQQIQDQVGDLFTELDVTTFANVERSVSQVFGRLRPGG